MALPFSFKAQVIGLEPLRKALGKSRRDSVGALTAALYQMGFAIMGRSKRLVPVDTGRLRASGYVAPPVGGALEPVVEIGYGTNYAVPVHERTEVNHPVGQAMFLKKAVDDLSQGFARKVATLGAENLRRGRSVSAIPAQEPTRPKGGKK